MRTGCCQRCTLLSGGLPPSESLKEVVVGSGEREWWCTSCIRGEFSGYHSSSGGVVVNHLEKPHLMQLRLEAHVADAAAKWWKVEEWMKDVAFTETENAYVLRIVKLMKGE